MFEENVYSDPCLILTGTVDVVYNGTGDTAKVYIEQETAMVNAGTPVYAVVSAKKIN